MKVLLAISESRGAKVAAEFLETIPLPHNSIVTVLHIVELPRLAPQYPGYYRTLESWCQQAFADANRLVTSVATRLRGSGVRVQTRVVKGIPRRDLVKAIRRLRPGLVILGPHTHPRVARFFLGSVSEHMLSVAPCSVLIARSRRRTVPSSKPRVLFATDFSQDADAAATFLPRLNLPRSSRITVAHVDEQVEEVMARFVAKGRPDLHQALAKAVRVRQRQLARLLERVGRRFVRRGWTVTPSIVNGYPAEQLLRLATKQRADLIVLGSRGLTGFKRMLLGGVSGKVARHAPCSVLVVRRTPR